MKVLFLNTNKFDRNGMSTFIMNYAIEFLRNGIEVDIAYNTEMSEEYSHEIQKNGGNVYCLGNRNFNILPYIIKLKRIIKKNKYDVVYIHGNSSTIVADVLASKKFKNKIVVHAHGVTTNHPIIHLLFRKILSNNIDMSLAASEEAGNFLFLGNTFQVIPNGIDLRKVSFDENKREKIRKKLGIKQNEKLIVQLAAFTYQKNQEFSVALAEEMEKINSKVKFALFGSGDRKEDIIKLVKSENIQFFEPTSDVYGILSASDGVIFPSRFEPFGIVALEAQAAGVPIAVSEVFIRELKLTESINYLPLKIDSWVTWLNNIDIKKTHLTEDKIRSIKTGGYDIQDNALSLQNKFIGLIKYETEN